MSNLSPLFTTGKDDWQTPSRLFDTYMARYNFTIDGAASTHTHRLPVWWGPGGVVEDMLTTTPAMWRGQRVFLNPPYSQKYQSAFVRHALRMVRDTDALAGVLVPARTDTKLFHDVVWDRAACAPHSWVSTLDFVKGRVKFVSDTPLRRGTNNSAPFPSMFVVFGRGL
jgi:hypothetical protein